MLSQERTVAKPTSSRDPPPPVDRGSGSQLLRASERRQRAWRAVGMRGGLGRTLLTAFLLLAILPLTVTTLFASSRIRKDVQRELTDRLDAVLSFKAAQLFDWWQEANREMGRLASRLDVLPRDASAYAAALRGIEAGPDGSFFEGLLLVEVASGTVLYASDPVLEAETRSGWDVFRREASVCSLAGSLEGMTNSLLAGQAGMDVDTQPSGCRDLGLARAADDVWLVGLLRIDPLLGILADRTGLGATGRTRLVLPGGVQVLADGIQAEPLPLMDASGTEDQAASFPMTWVWNRGEPSIEWVVSRALAGESGSLAYLREDGEQVLGVYRWLPELQLALLAGQSEQEVMAASEDLVALIIAVTLAAALLTAPIAALVARRITTPVVELTVSAARMSKGQLNERVDVKRDDEIGLLARAFNRMAAELEELYSGLEAKVQERTHQLAEATERARRHAKQLATSAEVARMVTSIRDLDPLLTTVAQTIADAFGLHHVSIYLLDEVATWAVRQAGSQAPHPGADRVAVGGPTLVGQVAADGKRRMMRGRVPSDDGEAAEVEDGGQEACELVVPLRVQDQLLGVIDLWTHRRGAMDDSDQLVYQSLADQISIAIENARAYAAERETIARLQELDRIQAQFLTNMSHALRTPLNSLLGFSRILLKELEGPLTDVQRDDLTTIYQSGRQLLGLINDMLELSHLEIGTAPFSVARVNLPEIIEGVMATARALALGKPVRLYQDVPQHLPVLYSDSQRVRQVILALLSNAVKFTDEGVIRLRVTADADQIAVSVQDTGVGIPQEERVKIFADRSFGDDAEDDGVPGFGLAISKRVVEKLGGQIWVESDTGVGSIFTFTLPLRSPTGERALQDRGRVALGQGQR